jgi:SCP-2 sterol transfer family protein
VKEFRVDKGAMRAEIDRLANVFASMIRPLADTSIRVPDSDWTVGEHAAHLVKAQEGFATMVEGGRVDYRGNAHQLDCFNEREGATLAHSLIAFTRDFLRAADDNEGITRKHPGFSPQTMTQWTSYSLCHILMHMAPVAGALGLASPVRRLHLDYALPFFQVVLPAILDKSQAAGVCGRLAIQATDGPSFSLNFEDGELVVEPSTPESADCCIKASSATIFSVSLDLMTESCAIQQGDWVISGSSPELGKSFKLLLPIP